MLGTATRLSLKLRIVTKLVIRAPPAAAVAQESIVVNPRQYLDNKELQWFMAVKVSEKFLQTVSAGQ